MALLGFWFHVSHLLSKTSLLAGGSHLHPGTDPSHSRCHSCSHKEKTQSRKANTHLLFKSLRNFSGMQYRKMPLFPHETDRKLGQGDQKCLALLYKSPAPPPLCAVSLNKLLKILKLWFPQHSARKSKPSLPSGCGCQAL